MIKKIVLGVFAISFLLTPIACKKKLSTYAISDNLKSWVAFQPGSYWIYKNDSTGVLDSTFMKYPTNYYTVGDQYGDADYQQIEQYFNSKILDSFFFTFTCSPYSFNDYNDRFIIFFKTTWGGEASYLAIDPHVPYNEQVNACHQQNSLYIKDHYDSLQINNVMYYDVTYAKDWSTNPTIKYNSEIYLGKNIGLIRVNWEDPDEPKQSWSLLRSNIKMK
jgi:hypothetical protein